MDYDLKEEEMEIIDAFGYEMEMYGYKGFYSFHEGIDNGYLIYKEDNHWVKSFVAKGEITKTKKYTNIYNLCLDIFDELKIDNFYFYKRDLKIPRGTRVIITKSTDCPIDEIRRGVIITSKFDETTSERIYQVLDDDGQIYDGLYGLKIYGDIYFRTMEDYIKDSEKEIADNVETIQELKGRSWALTFNIQEIYGDMDMEFGNGKGM